MTEVDVTFVFDEIVGRHMERLLGSRHGIGGLQLGVGTIACLTLLADQLERGEKGEQPSGENSRATLETRLAELGLQDKEKAQSLIQELREKGYVLEDEKGTITGGKPAVSMAKLLERVFPKLPGQTLVAYFIQTIDEVLSGRKTMEVAVAHFDQTLKMQGLPLQNRKTEKKPPSEAGKKKSADHVVRETPGIMKSTSAPVNTSREATGGVRIIGSAGDGFRYSMKDLHKVSSNPSGSPVSAPEQIPESEGAPENPPPKAEDLAEKSLEIQLIATELPAEPGVEDQPVVIEPQPLAAPETRGESQPVPEQSRETDMVAETGSPAETGQMKEKAEQNTDQVEEGGSEQESESAAADQMISGPGIESPAPDQERQPGETGDDLIEKQIAGFQNELASLCPLCKEGRVREEKTETGKPYYKCNNKACNLVSWGRPHHVSCPVCSNPFLIEVSSDSEKVSLQCPRATCKYQCTFSHDEDNAGGGKAAPPVGQAAPENAAPKRKRRVVRRRLVRKKKS